MTNDDNHNNSECIKESADWIVWRSTNRLIASVLIHAGLLHQFYTKISELMLVRLIRDWFHSQCQESEKQGKSRNHPEDQFKKSQSLIFWLSLSFQLLIYQISVFTQVLCSITADKHQWTMIVHTHIGDKKGDIRGCFRVFCPVLKGQTELDNLSSHWPTSHSDTR